jgi:4-hydroxy-3-polyprenylbenzoate decarboxylase
MRLIIGMTGASGVVYGIELLRFLKIKGVETHLVLTQAARAVIKSETKMTTEDVVALVTNHYEIDDMTAPIASGGFEVDGMIVIPCSMKSLAGMTHGYADNLLLRAADVTLKEKRLLIVVPRETPLSVIHLKNMVDLAKAGAVLLPAMPAWYHKPENLQDIVDHLVGKILDILGIRHELYRKWGQ